MQDARPGARKKALECLAGILIALVVIGVLAVFVAFYENSPPSASVEPQARLFIVPRGSSAYSVSRRLENEGFIRSADFFTLYLRVTDTAERLEAGTYEIPPRAGMHEIARMMVEGRQALRKITVPEGYTLKDIASILDEAGVCRADDFLAASRDPALLAERGIPGPSAEGYAFPDTYDFPLLSDGSFVLGSMIANFFRSVGREFPESAALGPEKLSEAVILASIVEREYRIKEEAPRIAGVFMNRLRIGMGLQSCATIVYIISDILGGKRPDVIRVEDLSIKSPYNTYLWAGLPPGPISNPGLVALGAAFRPEKNEYLYFRLTDPAKGAHTFTRSLDEHIEAGVIPVKGKNGGR
jgi:UPF0755 protein